MAKIILHKKSTLDFDCPHCGQELKVEWDMQGALADCPSCGKELTCPTATPSVPVAKPRRPNLAIGEFRCENCDFIGMPIKKAKGNLLVTLILFLMGGLPGMIYMLIKCGYNYICPKCGYNYKTDGIV